MALNIITLTLISESSATRNITQKCPMVSSPILNCTSRGVGAGGRVWRDQYYIWFASSLFDKCFWRKSWINNMEGKTLLFSLLLRFEPKNAFFSFFFINFYFLARKFLKLVRLTLKLTPPQSLTVRSTPKTYTSSTVRSTLMLS